MMMIAQKIIAILTMMTKKKNDLLIFHIYGTILAPLVPLLITSICKRLPSIYSEALLLLHFLNYSIIVATRPDPTVLPPSRIANVRPWSIAIG